MVFVPLTRQPTPCASLPYLFAAKVSHIFLTFGSACVISCQNLICLPVSLFITASALYISSSILATFFGNVRAVLLGLPCRVPNFYCIFWLFCYCCAIPCVCCWAYRRFAARPCSLCYGFGCFAFSSCHRLLLVSFLVGFLVGYLVHMGWFALLLCEGPDVDVTVSPVPLGI